MSSAPAYRIDRAAQRSTRTRQNADIRVVRTGKRTEAGVAPAAAWAATIAVIAMCLIAAIACVRVALTTATVGTVTETESLTVQVDNLKSANSTLEINESNLASSRHVKDIAQSQLGMVESENPETLTLPSDAVAYDENGNLSLSASLAAAAQ